MSNFEDSMKATVISSSKSDPPETDLDYYSRPENYTGSNLQSLQRFIIAKDKQEKSQQVVKKLKKKKEGFNLFERYKHILKGYVDEPEPSSSSSEDEGEGEEKKDEQKDVGEAETLPKIQEEAEEEGEEKKEEQQKTQEEKEGGLQTPDRLSPEKIPSGVLPEDGKSEMSIDRMSPRSPGDMTGSPRDSIVGTSSKRSIAPSSGRQSMMMKAKMQTLAKEVRQQVAAKKIASKKARERFKKAYKFVRIVMTLSSSAAQSGPSDGKMKTFTDIANEAETTACISSQGLSFDPNYFKAKKEEQICGDMSVIRSKSASIVYCQIQISTETKNILCLPSDERTPEQIQTAMYGLQSLRSFAEYPLHMQEKLAKVAWYEVVPPKRIIIRQGHFAENFYFILSGQAVVTLLLRDPKTGASFVKTATIMRKGMSFGELALLHHSRRTATVTSQGLVQLLTIGREDFFDIFMSGQGPDELPEHIKFISQCDFFEHWPLEELVEHPEQCLLHFFKRNVVVVKDSTQSEWIYVVKSGSCIVLKQLKGVTARLGRKTKLNSDTKLPKLQMAPAKVDTGLRNRRRVKSAGAEREIEKDIVKQVRVQTPVSDRGARETEDKHFSKSQYSKFPATHKAYFSPLRRPPAKKPYEIPKRCKPPKRKEPEVENTGKPPPVFVQVDVLKPKDAFGLETIDFDDGIERPKTVVTLVSQGAECVMMSKAFFAKHANERVKRWIRHQIRPYPIDETFQENLQIKVDWELYKADLINDLTSRI